MNRRRFLSAVSGALLGVVLPIQDLLAPLAQRSVLGPIRGQSVTYIIHDDCNFGPQPDPEKVKEWAARLEHTLKSTVISVYSYIPRET